LLSSFISNWDTSPAACPALSPLNVTTLSLPRSPDNGKGIRGYFLLGGGLRTAPGNQEGTDHNHQADGAEKDNFIVFHKYYILSTKKYPAF